MPLASSCADTLFSDMKKEILLENRTITYTLKRSRRARRMRMSVYCDGTVVVTAPGNLHELVAERFIREKTQWLFSKLAFYAQRGNRPIPKRSRAEYVRHKAHAYDAVMARVHFFNTIYLFDFNAIKIRNQKTRWGSCSKKKNLNFNYKIVFLPPHLIDYIVVHELCHLGAFNHSQKFWNLVSKAMPNHHTLRRELKNIAI